MLLFDADGNIEVIHRHTTGGSLNPGIKPVFDSRGKVVGWFIEYNKVVVDLSGWCRAFVSDGNVFSYEGDHLGSFADGYFWDRETYAVTFVEGAMGIRGFR